MAQVESLLRRLPANYRRVLELRFIQRLSVAETADQMGITRGNAKVLQYRALRKGRTRFCPVKLYARTEGIKPVIRAMREGLPYFMLFLSPIAGSRRYDPIVSSDLLAKVYYPSSPGDSHTYRKYHS